jgi:hypothetical protein
MLMDPDNYLKMAIIIGSVTGIIVLVTLCIVYRTHIFRLICGDQTAIVVPEVENTIL